MRSLLVIVLALTYVSNVFAQTPPLSEGQIVSLLTQSKPEIREQTLSNLGVPKEIAQTFRDLDASMSSGIAWFRLHPTRLKTAALFLPCLDQSGGAFLFLLTKGDSGWKVHDSYYADCHYKADVSVELVSNIIPGKDSILLHQDCIEHGTGAAVHNFHVFNPVNGKLREILKTEESRYSLYWSEPDGSEKRELRRSFFIPVLSPNGTKIEQILITQQLDGVTALPLTAGEQVRRRIWSWLPQMGRMVATRWQSTVASTP